MIQKWKLKIKKQQQPTNRKNKQKQTEAYDSKAKLGAISTFCKKNILNISQVLKEL